VAWRLQGHKCPYCSAPPPVKCGRNSGFGTKHRDQRRATILETNVALNDDLLHLLAQLLHLGILIDDIDQLHEAKPVMRGKRLVGTRVKRFANLIDKIPEYGHHHGV
jgi:hypothetical protein